MADQEHGSYGFGEELNDRSEHSGNRLESFYAIGLELYTEGKFSEAAGYFEKALSLNRHHMGSIKYLGLAMFHLGQYERSVERFQQYIRKTPDNDEVLWYCGMAFLHSGRYQDAERYQIKVISLEPENVKGYLGLGQVLYHRGLYNEAVKIFKKGEELEGNNAELLFLLGEAYNKLDVIDLAISCFEKVLKVRQDNPRVYYNLGILYDKKGLPQKASPMYRRAKEFSSPQAAIRQESSWSQTKREDGLFFSRSLTVVNQADELSEVKPLSKDRYENFRKKQMRKKPHQVPEQQQQLEEGFRNAGTMDLTKASLKILEAIKIIKKK